MNKEVPGRLLLLTGHEYIFRSPIHVPSECLSLHTKGYHDLFYCINTLQQYWWCFVWPERPIRDACHLFPLEEAHIVSSINIPPPTTTTNTHPRHRNAIWRKIWYFIFTRALWLRTRLSHVYNLIRQRDYDNHFSTWLFLYFSLPLFVCILYPLLLFLLCSCFEKIDQMWSDYHFLIF